MCPFSVGWPWLLLDLPPQRRHSDPPADRSPDLPGDEAGGSSQAAIAAVSAARRAGRAHRPEATGVPGSTWVVCIVRNTGPIGSGPFETLLTKVYVGTPMLPGPAVATPVAMNIPAGGYQGFAFVEHAPLTVAEIANYDHNVPEYNEANNSFKHGDHSVTNCLTAQAARPRARCFSSVSDACHALPVTRPTDPCFVLSWRSGEQLGFMEGSSGGGCSPIRWSSCRRSTRRGRFESRRAIVARPYRVRPITRWPSSLQAKCSSHRCWRGWYSGTRSPVTGSRAATAVYLRPLQAAQA